ncbi:MAG: hypothetical protein R3C61_28995 [Bacteroidia bacterium]
MLEHALDLPSELVSGGGVSATTKGSEEDHDGFVSPDFGVGHHDEGIGVWLRVICLLTTFFCWQRRYAGDSSAR